MTTTVSGVERYKAISCTLRDVFKQGYSNVTVMCDAEEHYAQIALFLGDADFYQQPLSTEVLTHWKEINDACQGLVRSVRVRQDSVVFDLDDQGASAHNVLAREGSNE